MFLGQHQADGHVGGAARDVRQVQAQAQGALHGRFNMRVGPGRRQQPFFGRQGADGDGAGAAMAVPDARDGLAQLAHITRIVAQQQVFTHGGVQRWRRALPQLGEEMPGQRQDVVLAFAQGRRLATPAGDAVIQVGAKGAARHFVLQFAVGGAHESELCGLPGIAAHALVFAFLDGAQQLRLQC